jgi:hypothetical protein
LQLKIRVKLLLDCYVDFYLPTLRKRTILRRLKKNMLDGRCDALFMLDETNQRHLMGREKFKTNGVYHNDTRCVLYVKSWCQRQSLGLDGIDGNFHWKCDVFTNNHALGEQDFVDNGMDVEEYEGGDALLHHFTVDTGVHPDAYSFNANTYEDYVEVRASKRQFTPEGLKRSWIRAFPSIRREIRKLKRCHTCQKRVQAHTRCESCVMAG